MNIFSQPSILDLLVEKGIACQKCTLCNNFHQQEDVKRLDCDQSEHVILSLLLFTFLIEM